MTALTSRAHHHPEITAMLSGRALRRTLPHQNRGATGDQDQQQVHLDLHVDDLEAATALAIELGGRRLQASRRPADNPDGTEMFTVCVSPAGHPFCLGVH